MKAPLLVGIIAFAAAAASSFSRGVTLLDNYNASGPNVTYGRSWPITWPDGGVSGQGLGAGWTAGLYYAPGTVLGESYIGSDIPPAPFVLGTGPCITAPFFTSAIGIPGEFLALSAFYIDPNGPPGGATFTIILTAYYGPDYNSSLLRAHSAAFIMTTSPIISPNPNAVGSFMAAFSVLLVPEPSAFSFVGAGALAWLIFRSRSNRSSPVERSE